LKRKEGNFSKSL